MAISYHSRKVCCKFFVPVATKGFTAEHAELAEEKNHHGVTRKATDFFNRRRTQTSADIKVRCGYSNDRSKAHRESPAVTDKRAYLCLQGLPLPTDLIDGLPAARDLSSDLINTMFFDLDPT